MVGQVHPRYVKKALDLIAADLSRAWTVGEIAAASGVARRTLQKHFRRFVGKTPLEFLRDARFEHARQALLRAKRGTAVAEVAARFGFSHLGRFAIGYRARYNEAPSETVRRGQVGLVDGARFLPLLPSSLERPAVAVLPFDLVGDESLRAAAIADEISAALLRRRWFGVSTPDRSRYRLRGKVRGDGRGRLRVTVVFADATTGRILWADHCDGACDEVFALEARVADRVAAAIELVLRDSEIDRASRADIAHLGAWELTMRALPSVLSYEASAEAMALELLERAMEIAPHDPLPLSLAAWCHGVRSCLHFAERPKEEQLRARMLADRAATLNKADALTETVLAAGYTLARDLTTAAVHAERALTLNGGLAWAWGRSGWISAFSGEYEKATEQFRIARAIAPVDPVSALCCYGLASPHMEAGRYDDAIRWIKRGLAESPTAVWINPFLASCYALSNRKDEAKQTLAAWQRTSPDMTVTQIRSGLPFGAHLFDRLSEGLESAGIRNPS